MKLMPRKRSTGMTEASVLSQWDHYLEVCKADNDRVVELNGGRNAMSRLSDPLKADYARHAGQRGGRPKKVLEIANG